MRTDTAPRVLEYIRGQRASLIGLIKDELGDNVVCTILCASDPYAVVGVQKAFGLTPDLVTGPATTTSAAVELVRKLTGLRGINIIDPAAKPAFKEFLEKKLNIARRSPPSA